MYDASRRRRSQPGACWTPRAAVRYVRRVERDVDQPATRSAVPPRGGTPADVVVGVLATGRPADHRVARGAVRSALRPTPFDVFVAVGERAPGPRLPAQRRAHRALAQLLPRPSRTGSLRLALRSALRVGT